MQEIFFIKPGNYFLQKFEKFRNVILGQCNVETVQASRASHAQKSRGLRLVLSKNFSRAAFFVFWVTYLVDIYLSYLLVLLSTHETNLMKMRSVRMYYVLLHF